MRLTCSFRVVSGMSKSPSLCVRRSGERSYKTAPVFSVGAAPASPPAPPFSTSVIGTCRLLISGLARGDGDGVRSSRERRRWKMPVPADRNENGLPTAAPARAPPGAEVRAMGGAMGGALVSPLLLLPRLRSCSKSRKLMLMNSSSSVWSLSRS